MIRKKLDNITEEDIENLIVNEELESKFKVVSDVTILTNPVELIQ